jgi:hypothetical protein
MLSLDCAPLFVTYTIPANLHDEPLSMNIRGDYSPEFNPVEMAFAKLKALPIKTFSPVECLKYLATAGYDRE